MNVTQLEIANFLMRMKKLVKSGKNIYFVKRKENTDALLKYNLTLEQVWKILFSMTATNQANPPQRKKDQGDRLFLLQ